MWPDRISSPRPLANVSDALPTAPSGPANILYVKVAEKMAMCPFTLGKNTPEQRRREITMEKVGTNRKCFHDHDGSYMYSRTSMARTLMARLFCLTRTRSWVPQ